jgi:hypothetical protein
MKRSGGRLKPSLAERRIIMQKWEYWVATLDALNDSTVIDWLNKSGQDGWELVNMIPHWLMNYERPTDTARVVVLVVKRPITESPKS